MNHSPVLFYVKVHSITHKLFGILERKRRVFHGRTGVIWECRIWKPEKHSIQRENCMVVLAYRYWDECAAAL